MQIIVLAVVGIAFAFLLFNTVLKGNGASSEPSTATDPALAADPAAATVDPAATPVDPAAPIADPSVAPAPAAPPASADPGAAEGLLPAKGLPKDVLVAYAKGKAIALLVVNPKGMSDGKLEAFTRRLDARDDVAVFIVDVETSSSRPTPRRLVATLRG